MKPIYQMHAEMPEIEIYHDETWCLVKKKDGRRWEWSQDLLVLKSRPISESTSD